METKRQSRRQAFVEILPCLLLFGTGLLEGNMYSMGERVLVAGLYTMFVLFILMLAVGLVTVLTNRLLDGPSLSKPYPFSGREFLTCLLLATGIWSWGRLDLMRVNREVARCVESTLSWPVKGEPHPKIREVITTCFDSRAHGLPGLE